MDEPRGVDALTRITMLLARARGLPPSLEASKWTTFLAGLRKGAAVVSINWNAISAVFSAIQAITSVRLR